MVKKFKRLTEFSPSGGCGCKVSSSVLKKLLKPIKQTKSKKYKVSFNLSDDAAVYELEKNKNIVSTVDFFAPIVDEPLDFGKISATNAISDIYAMGGKPLFALSILGIPRDNIKVEDIKKILQGASETCADANIYIMGGHTIELNEPIFGLCVIGEINNGKIITNKNAKYDDIIILTKPLGVGIYSAALKKKLLLSHDYNELIETTTLLNKPGNKLSELFTLNAMTDVTGFGLIGHLNEVCTASNVEATLYTKSIPKLENVDKYMKMNAITGASKKNYNNFRDKVKYHSSVSSEMKSIICDPQTSGGLLIFAPKTNSENILMYLKRNGFRKADVIGEIKKSNYKINVF